MTREEMIKKRWKPYEPIFINDGGRIIECLVCGTNFDAELIYVMPISDAYEQQTVSFHIQFVTNKKSILHT